MKHLMFCVLLIKIVGEIWKLFHSVLFIFLIETRKTSMCVVKRFSCYGPLGKKSLTLRGQISPVGGATTA